MKLYEVTLTYKALVLAEDETKALRLRRDILDYEAPQVDVSEYSSLPPKWTASTLVYHEKGGDITVARAVAMQGEEN